MGMPINGYGFCGDKNVLKFIVMVNILNLSEFYTLSGCIVWNLIVSIKLLFKKVKCV